MDSSVILFDGVCNLCNGAVNFIIDRDPKSHFKFAALQSSYARDLLAQHGVHEAGLGTIVLVEQGRHFVRSTAALRIARGMAGAWPLLYALIVIPRFLRDLVYDFVARNRYRWFGKEETCRVPTPELRARFVDASAKTQSAEASS